VKGKKNSFWFIVSGSWLKENNNRTETRKRFKHVKGKLSDKPETRNQKLKNRVF
jgi:hypothetical protein